MVRCVAHHPNPQAVAPKVTVQNFPVLLRSHVYGQLDTWDLFFFSFVFLYISYMYRVRVAMHMGFYMGLQGHEHG